MKNPQRLEDHPAPLVKIRATVPRKPDKEFKLKAVNKDTSWIEWYMGQKYWLE